MDRTSSTPRPSGLRSCFTVGGIVAGAVIAAGGIGWWWWSSHEAAAIAAQEQAAEAAFAPAKAKLAADATDDVDIDKTVRILHQVDEAMRHQGDVHEYLASVAREDWRGVPKDVLEARTELLDAELTLYGKQTELDAQEASWSLSRDIVLTTLSVVSVQGQGGIVPAAKFAVDREAAERRLEELRTQQSERRELIRDVDEQERALIEASMKYAGVWAKYLEEYDRVCYHRDRAWMASGRGDWAEVESEARAAIAQAPHEKEAHMLLARALIEGGQPEQLTEARILLEPFASGETPGAMAPALLLRGTLKEREGDLIGASDDYRHASLAYPTEAERLADALDPYKMRSSLRKSKAGAGIVESYSATMVGAGWFSPELHLARLAYARGDREAGKQAVIDHFERRRAQQQWDYILADLTWAQSVLGDDFASIFPEEDWLDLHAEKSYLGMGSKFTVSVDNRSAHPLKNAALVLCVRFTDMLGGDYVTLAGERTVPELPAHTTTDFGAVDVDTEVFGKLRTEDDIVDLRAILVTDDGVLWVDTEKYKEERLRVAREKRKAEPPPPTELDRWTRVADEAGREATVTRDKGLVQDTLEIELPAKLVWLKPKFTLHYGEATLVADTNVVEGDKIKLRFKGIGDLLSRGDPAREADLVCESVFGTFTLSFGPTPDGGWTYLGAKAE